jgi:hypothetical protein
MPRPNIAVVDGHGFVGKCFFAPNAPFLSQGKARCAEFLFHVTRNARGNAKGSVIVQCETSPPITFRSNSVSNLVINGNTAAFAAVGKIDSGGSIPSTGSATITATDNDGHNDLFSVVLSSGRRSVCSASNAVSGDIEVLTGNQKDTDGD